MVHSMTAFARVEHNSSFGTLSWELRSVNLVFMLMFCFVLLVLLSLSIGVSQLADKCKRLTQENAILEKRVRDLEKKLSGK